MEEKQCKDCQYFLQHLALNRRRLFCVCCGHCTLRKPKRKQPDAKACEQFIPGPQLGEAFVTKEYLSKELLQYVLNLELLPEIDGRG